MFTMLEDYWGYKYNRKAPIQLEFYLKGWRIIERRRKEGTIDVADRIYLINFYR